MLEDYKYGTRHSIRRVCRIKKSVEPVPQRTQSVAPPRSRLARQIRCRRHRRQESENAWRFGAGSRRAHDHFRDYTPTTVEEMTRRRNELLSDKATSRSFSMWLPFGNIVFHFLLPIIKRVSNACHNCHSHTVIHRVVHSTEL
jgi:deoxyribodipyrimidine photolyase